MRQAERGQERPGRVRRLRQEPRVDAERKVTLAIGPDGGWVPFEVDQLERVGFTPVSFGARVLRVEVAVSHVLGRIR